FCDLLPSHPFLKTFAQHRWAKSLFVWAKETEPFIQQSKNTVVINDLPENGIRDTKSVRAVKGVEHIIQMIGRITFTISASLESILANDEIAFSDLRPARLYLLEREC